ncbi:GTP cyclohydrolase II [Pseudoalteromonas denitrificans]|uniref:GTP cyclohydrolase II n=1 Tax=Pseudoalteromonas denitrificans DSM 6059 TaxID=1123010 RepID=A0A1I1KMC6_9GAMM|nr:GTP cyclohydrolase II [Pseudoalteromonas denitrificans]SFC61432.1 GTP cyclohydrolase II [Pseudoalteromonas denitrificans DSM 6059]
MKEYLKTSHVILTSHSNQAFQESAPVKWGAKNPKERGPVIATISTKENRNAIGSHSGSYTVYRALSIAAGSFAQDHIPDLTNTSPTVNITPKSSWHDAEKIISLDPWGASIGDVFSKELKEGFNIQPSIAITQAHLTLPEINDAVEKGRLKPDGVIVKENGDVFVTKVAIEPVWYLPGIAKRFGIAEGTLRKILFQETGGMFPELVTRPDLKILLPPIGSTTAYIFGDINNLADESKVLTCRVHDECNGSDVFGSDICTCRPYLMHGIEEAVKTAQNGGVGLIVYFRKEGRALGEVTKLLVYNARKRQKGGDSAATYFERTECVAGIQDARFQEFMPDVLHWFGIKKIDHLVSMSNMKYNAIVKSGITVIDRVSIPKELVPDDAQVEIEAKKAAGYFSDDEALTDDELDSIKGRDLS